MIKRNAIVIGAGFGGIAAALRLKAKGYNVTIIEKHNDLGGRARTFVKNGYTFDAGPTVITAPYLLEELFNLFNKNISNYVKIISLDIWYKFIFSDNTTFTYGKNYERIYEQILKISPDDVEGFKELLKYSEKIFNKGFLDLGDKSFSNLFFMMKQIPALIKLKSYISVYKLVSKFLRNEKLRRVFSIHPLLVGGNPFSTTSIYLLILYLEKKWGVHYAMGGTGKIINALEKLMIEEKIQIIKSDEVYEIITEKSRVTGVKTKSGRFLHANHIICNADPPFVYKKLIKKPLKNKLFEMKINRMQYSMGLFVYYFGSKKKYENIEHHTIYFGETYKNLLQSIFEKKELNRDISFYLHRPTATDESMAPKNKDTFYVLVPVPNNQSKINWSIEGEKFKNMVIEKMDSTILPDIKNNIECDFYFTPDYFEKELNTTFGSGFSIEPKFSQSAYFRFHNKSEIINGLYFVGAGTHPGAGMPGVISSAKVLEKIIA